MAYGKQSRRKNEIPGWQVCQGGGMRNEASRYESLVRGLGNILRSVGVIYKLVFYIKEIKQ